MTEWWFLAAAGTAGWVLILSTAGVAVFVVARVAAQRHYTRPLDRLIAVSGRFSFARREHSDERDHAVALSRRRDRLGELARAILDVADDSRRRVVELSTLLETGRKVASSLQLDEVFDSVLSQLETVYGVDACSIMTFDERDQEFRVRASHGLSEEFADSLRIAPTDEHSPSMRALRSGAPVQVSDTSTDLAYTTGFRRRMTYHQFRSRLAIPLHTVYAPRAVLLLYKTEPYRYSYRELELASSLAGYASIALENAALHARTDEQLHDQTRRLEAIVESLEDGLVLEDLHGDVLFCNRSAVRLAGVAPLAAGGRLSTSYWRRCRGAPPTPTPPRRSWRRHVTVATAIRSSSRWQATATGVSTCSSSSSTSPTSQASASDAVSSGMMSARTARSIG